MNCLPTRPSRRHPGRLWALALGLLALVGCATTPPWVDTPAARAAMLDAVWRGIDERHVDPPPAGWTDARERLRAAVLDAPTDDPDGVWQALDRVAGERRDAHTRVEGPRDLRRTVHHEINSLGFTLALVEGQWVADRVLPDSPAARAGLQVGQRLLSWDGEPPEAVWERRWATARDSSTRQARELTTLRQWLDGPAGRPVALRWAQPDGSAWDVTLARETRRVPSAVVQQRLASGVTVLRWNRFDEALEPELLRALRQVPPGPGLVLDLRGNGGGSFDMSKRLIGALLPAPAVVQVTHRRGGSDRTLHRVGGAPLYAGPLVLLVDRASASGSEMLAGSLQALGRARVVGETSCGCLLGIRRYLDLAPNARLAISEQALALPDGRRIEAVGVQPDVPVPRRLAALRAGRDEALAAAEALLLPPLLTPGAAP